MKAIIMAGGEGSRLRPLTCDCPKPMMRLMDKPVMQYAVELLARHSVKEIAATLGYLPEAISDYFGDGSDFGVQLRYYVEKEPMGTAGGVRQAREFLDETFIVLSGDGITDLDITAAATFHREKHALATIVLRREENPLEYGVVATGADGRISKFYEKPCRCDVFSDMINTGIYILEPEVLERIPENRSFDFGHDLFPMLASECAPVYGYVMDGYWCDIGDIRAYLGAHMSAMNGEISLDGAVGDGRMEVRVGAVVEHGAVIEAPCLICEGARICAGAHVGAYSVIGENCVIEAGACVKRSVLWPNARLERGAQARGCVLGARAVIGAEGQVYEECVLAAGAAAGERSVLMPGVKLWPCKRTLPGERLDANLVWGGLREEGFNAGALTLTSPSQAARAAQACAAALHPRELLLGRGAASVAGAMWHAAAAGAMAQGVRVIDAGVCTLAQLRHAQTIVRAEGAALVTEDALTPLNALGARILPKEQRAVNTLCARQDFAAPFAGTTHLIQAAGRTDIAYIAAAAARFTAEPINVPPIALCAQSAHLLSLAERAFLRAGLTVRSEGGAAALQLCKGEIGVEFDDSGECAALFDENARPDEAERQMMLAWTALMCGERELLLPVSATRAADDLAERFGARTVYIAGDASTWMNELAGRHPFQFALWFDGIQYALCALSALASAQLTLEEWRRSRPKVYRSSRVVGLPLRDTGHVLRAFAEREEAAELGGGVRFYRDGGWAWICPDERKPEFHIVAESADVEFARELCDFCEREMRRASENAFQESKDIKNSHKV